MRRVVSTREVAHIWAAHNRGETPQSEARNGSGSIRFQDAVLRSYGVEIARFARAPDGSLFVYTDECGHSVTSSRHRREAARALGPTVREIGLDKYTTGPRDAIDQLLIEAQKWRDKSARSRDPHSVIEWAVTPRLERAAWLSEKFGLPLGTLQWELRRMQRQADGRKLWGNAARFFRGYYAAADSLWRNLGRALFGIGQGRRWLAGERVNLPHHYGDAMLRLGGDPATVETSNGAEFPLAHGLKALPLIQACRSTGREWQRSDHEGGPRLGHYVLDRVSAEGNVQAGCHYVPWWAIEHLVSSLPAGQVSDEA